MSFSFSAISMVVNINEDKVVEGEGIHGEKHPQSGFVRLSPLFLSTSLHQQRPVAFSSRLCLSVFPDN